MNDDPLAVAVWTRLLQLVHRTQRDAEAAVAAHGLTPAQLFVLWMLEEKEGVSQAEIAQRLGVSAPNVSQLLSKLEQQRWVERPPRGATRAPALTAEGRALVAATRPEHAAFLTAKFAALTTEEQQLLRAWLDRLLSARP